MAQIIFPNVFPGPRAKHEEEYLKPQPGTSGLDAIPFAEQGGNSKASQRHTPDPPKWDNLTAAE